MCQNGNYHEWHQHDPKQDGRIWLQLDTASDITLISRKTYEKLGSPTVRPSNHVASNAYDDVLNLEGELEYQMCLVDRQIQTKCFLTEQPGLDLLGLDLLDELGLLKRIINTIAEDKMPTSVANLIERAEKKVYSEGIARKTSLKLLPELRREHQLIPNR